MRILLPEDGFPWEKFLHLSRAGGFSGETEDGFFELAVILRGSGAAGGGFRCGTLLLWEGAGEDCLQAVRAEQVVSCGFSPQNTLTPASTEPGQAVITVQREMKRPDGGYVWPQDIPLPPEWSALPLPRQMVLTGLRLLGAEE